jgi:hypothetical protein
MKATLRKLALMALGAALLALLPLSLPRLAFAQNVACYIDQGGAVFHVGSGCAVSLDTGGSLQQATAISMTSATGTVTAALHAGKVIAFGATAGTALTLPAATGTGNVYTFVIAVTATSVGNVIKVANATDVMAGSYNLQQDVDSAGTLKMWQSAATDDTMTFAGAATTGGIKGGWIRCTDYLSGFWSCQAFTSSGGGSEATPFSATVS